LRRIGATLGVKKRLKKKKRTPEKKFFIFSRGQIKPEERGYRKGQREPERIGEKKKHFP